MSNREEVFRLAVKHSDAQSHSRTRAVTGWNFSKEGLLAFVDAVRSELDSDEVREQKRWDGHIRMEEGVRHQRLLEHGLPEYGDGEQRGSASVSI